MPNIDATAFFAAVLTARLQMGAVRAWTAIET
jgi:hypothetical protein